MDDFDPSLVITRVENGFILRGLNEVMGGDDIHQGWRVFHTLDELIEFCELHYSNMAKLEDLKRDWHEREAGGDSGTGDGNPPEESLPG